MTEKDKLYIDNRLEAFSKEEQAIRHASNNKLTERLFNLDEKMDNYKTDLALLKQAHITMQNDLKEIKTSTKEWFEDIKHLFNNLDKHFATKEEHKSNQKSIEWIVKIMWTFGIALIMWGGAFIWQLITNLIK